MENKLFSPKALALLVCSNA